jgi:hypothetical protein
MVPILTVLALAAAATPAPTPLERASAEWRDCVKGRIDAGLRSQDSADALVTDALTHCARQEDVIRATIAAERGEEVARLNIERVRNGSRQLFLLYIERERGRRP